MNLKIVIKVFDFSHDHNYHHEAEEEEGEEHEIIDGVDQDQHTPAANR